MPHTVIGRAGPLHRPLSPLHQGSMMTDVLDPATRSRLMSRVRNKDTAPEKALRRALCAAGLRGYRLHRRDVPGTPDVAWLGAKVAIFVDGAFWHGHQKSFKPGQSGTFWDEKIARNVERDRRINRALAKAGWTVVRLWDFEVERSAEQCVERVALALGHDGSDQ